MKILTHFLIYDITCVSQPGEWKCVHACVPCTYLVSSSFRWTEVHSLDDLSIILVDIMQMGWIIDYIQVENFAGIFLVNMMEFYYFKRFFDVAVSFQNSFISFCYQFFIFLFTECNSYIVQSAFQFNIKHFLIKVRFFKFSCCMFRTY